MWGIAEYRRSNSARVKRSPAAEFAHGNDEYGT